MPEQRTIPQPTSASAALAGLRAEDPKWREDVRRQLARWYRRHARALPWRQNRDPYRVWVSEIMLQQTQVATVVGYFERFIERFPTVEALAAASETDVLRLWEGLGYYRRARQLHEAARRVVREHSGQLPTDRHQLCRLPGIGRYTAGAILSIAMNRREPILEANSARLLARLLAWREPLATSRSQRVLWEAAEALLPRDGAGRFNEAMMEVGSLVCTARQPRCSDCPLARHCQARLTGMEDQIPAPGRRPAVEAVNEVVVVIRGRRGFLLRRCGAQERWAGLWDFARFALSEAGGRALAERAEQQAAKDAGLPLRIEEPLGVLKHSVTRYRITLHCFLASARAASSSPRPPYAWHGGHQMAELPLSSTGRRIWRLVAERS